MFHSESKVKVLIKSSYSILYGKYRTLLKADTSKLTLDKLSLEKPFKNSECLNEELSKF